MRTALLALAFCAILTTTSFAAPFEFITGVDVRLWPGLARPVGPGTFRDGDRLAGTSDTDPNLQVLYRGYGTPLFQPNHVGATTFLFRRGSVLAIVPLMGVDFLGGPLLDLDGDPNNGVRSLVPVSSQTPVLIPDSSSHADLSFDFNAGTVTITHFDATGTNEGGPGISPGVATTLVTIAGTNTDGSGGGDQPNPAFDTRTGMLTPHPTLPGVYRIESLQVELWYDSIEPNSSTAAMLGTFQHFVRFRGWLVLRDCNTDQFPALSGQGLGSTLWRYIETSAVGQQYNKPQALGGGTATIEDHVGGDSFTRPEDGGLPLTDFGGDLGAYLDIVVRPRVGPEYKAFVYLESGGFGINNSSDPIYGNTVGYDVVLAAAARSLFAQGDVNGDGDVNFADVETLIDVLLNPGAFGACDLDRADVSGDGEADGRDVAALVGVLV